MNEKYVEKNKKEIDLNKAILDYIEANNLLDGFENLKVYDVYKYRGSECISKLNYSYSYDSMRIYKFKIGNFYQELGVDLGSFKVPDARYGRGESKKEWDNLSPGGTSEIINFLRSDIRKNPNIITFLANVLKVDIEIALKEQEKSINKKKRNELSLEISRLDAKIYKLQEEKKALMEKLKMLSGENNDNNLKPILK